NCNGSKKAISPCACTEFWFTLSAMRTLHWLVGLILLGGCGTSGAPAAKTAADVGPNVPAAPNVDLSRCDAKGKRVDTVDTNNDGKPDVWKMYKQTAQGEVLVCKEVDLNHDARVDEITFYDDAGNRVLEQFDLDFDGKVDETVYYEA